MEPIYWKVSKSNLKYINGVYKNQLKIWLNIMYSGDYKYIYISMSDDIHVDGKTHSLSYMLYDENARCWFKKHGYTYNGEFNIKRDRQKKLKKICSK